MVLWILGVTIDLFHFSTKYLYFTTEIGIFVFSLAIYFAAFKGKKWSDPPEPLDDIPIHHWKAFARELLLGFVGLSIVLIVLWVITAFSTSSTFTAWLRKGAWFGYYIGVFVISIFLIRKHVKYAHPIALVTATISIVIFLTGYELLLLSNNTGWKYNDTVIGWFLGIPVDNLLFVYPVAPALTMIFYSILTRHLNNLKAFWLLNLVLAPASVIVELIGIYSFNLWEIFNEGSIWPMGQTNFEEFFYYILCQFLSIALYIFFSRVMVSPRTLPKSPTITGTLFSHSSR